MPSNTRWGYMWCLIQRYDLNVNFYNEWLPKPKYENDKFIMDNAIIDKHYEKNPWKIEIVNNCRLYLQIFTLGEIVNKNGVIENQFLSGEAQTENTETESVSQKEKHTKRKSMAAILKKLWDM